jgi:hypothetical protein
MRIGQLIDEWLERSRIRFLCGAALGVSLVFAVVSFATADQRRTLFGPPLGADFAGFYTAGQILRQPAPEGRERLYDAPYYDALYHQLLPHLQEEEKLPYVHPPMVALAMCFLAWLPYEWAFACWLLISAGLYLAGLLLTRRTLPELSALDWPTALLLALSFQPFLMECWLGGQLSAFGFFCVAAALACERTDRPVAAGLMLGFCLYKPTLLVLLLPMLVVARQWKMLAGFTLTGFGLGALSVIGAGWKNCLDYGQALLGFTRTTSGGSTPSAGALELRLWKYVDLNSFFKLLLGGHSTLTWILLLVMALVSLPFLARLWWNLDRADMRRRKLTWAATLTWTLVLNLYVGVYDSILVVLAAFLTAAFLFEGTGGVTLRFRMLLLLLFLIPWITQPIARAVGVQFDTLVLLTFAVYQLLAYRKGTLP